MGVHGLHVVVADAHAVDDPWTEILHDDVDRPG
jgi:hypothetical protein